MQTVKYMSLDTFEFMINTIKNLMDTARDFDKKMENVLGGDSYVISEINSQVIESIERYLTNHFEDEDNWVEYLIWEVIMSHSGQKLTIKIDEIELEANVENIYKVLTKTI